MEELSCVVGIGDGGWGRVLSVCWGPSLWSGYLDVMLVMESLSWWSVKAAPCPSASGCGGGLSRRHRVQVGKGKLSLAVTLLKVAGWEHVLNGTASSPGWRIRVIKWHFNLYFTFSLWMSVLLWSFMTHVYFFFLGIFMASVTVVSQCLQGIYGFILRTFLWGREMFSPLFYRLGTEAQGTGNWGSLSLSVSLSFYLCLCLFPFPLPLVWVLIETICKGLGGRVENMIRVTGVLFLTLLLTSWNAFLKISADLFMLND